MEITFRQARLAAGYTLRGLAAAIGVALSTIEAFDAGEVGPRGSGKRTPHGRTMKACTDVLGREVTDISEFRAVLGVEPRRESHGFESGQEPEDSELAADIQRLVEKHASREADRRTIAGAKVK